MIVQRALQSLGVRAMNDPAPGPGRPAGLSGPSPSLSLSGAIPMVASLGRARSASYLQIYRANPFVFAATNYIARAIGRVPFHVFELDAAGDKKRVRGDLPPARRRRSPGEQLDRILANPVYPSRAAAYGSMLRERLIYGRAIWEVLSDGGVPTGLRPVPWRTVAHVEPDGDGGVAYYKIRDGSPGRFRVLMGTQVVHFGLGSDIGDPLGVSVLESCHHTLALHDAIMRHLMAYMGNQVRPSGQWKADTAKAAREARTLITELYASPENAGKALVTNAEWQSMADSPDHAQLVELIKESRVEIAAAFQVPPPILGLLEQAIRANVTEMRSQFVRETIGPWTSETEDDFEGQLLTRVPSWSSMFVEAQLAEMLRPDLEARALVYQRLMFVMSIDEIRALENLPPLKLAGVTDVPWVQSGAMPLPTAAQGKARAPAPPGVSVADADRVIALTEALDRANGNGHLTAREITP